MSKRQIRFGEFVLDPHDERLWRSGEPIDLPPREFGVLLYLASRPGQLATKEELLDALWPDAHVSDAVLKAAISDVRRVLGENAKAPSIVQTVHRRGYRFVATVEEDQAALVEEVPSESPRPSLFGREDDLARLEREREAARDGTRRVVWITGEAGIGKTAIVEELAARARADGARVVQAQARERYGEGEAFQPVLEALGELCRREEGGRAPTVLATHAPSWLVQLPWAVRPEERSQVEAAARGARRERMLREVAEAIDALAEERPLVLAFEDLHWCDPSTLDVFTLLAERSSSVALLLVGTYRPVDAAVDEHPVRVAKRELGARGRSIEIGLEPLDSSAVEQWVRRELSGDVPSEVVRLIHRRTEGHPLFMTSFLGALRSGGHLEEAKTGWVLRRSPEEIEKELPSALRELLEREVARVDEEDLPVLECAGIAGREFDSAAVAAALQREIGDVEARLEPLSRRGDLVRSAGVHRADDGAVAGRYAFRHVLYQHAFADRVGPARKAALHASLARFFAERSESPSRLAHHYASAGLDREALDAWEAAGAAAFGRWANVEAVGHYERALDLVERQPSSEERDLRRLRLLTAIGPALSAVFGQGSPRVAETYRSARELSGRVASKEHLDSVLAGLFAFYVGRARFLDATEVAERMREIAEERGEVLVRQSAHLMVGTAQLYRGRLSASLRALDAGIGLASRGPSHPYGYAVEALASAFSALTAHLLGQDDDALHRIERAIDLARDVGDPYALSIALQFSAVVHRWRGEVDAVQISNDEVVTISEREGLEIWRPVTRWIQGWIDAERGDLERGLESMREALDHYEETGTMAARTEYLAATAAAFVEARQDGAARDLLEEGLEHVSESDERFAEPELHRLRAVLLTRAGLPAEATEARDYAAGVARKQGARHWLGRIEALELS